MGPIWGGSIACLQDFPWWIPMDRIDGIDR